jgi:hypothetical protein
MYAVASFGYTTVIYDSSYVTGNSTASWLNEHPNNRPEPAWWYSKRRRHVDADVAGRWTGLTSHSYPPALLEAASLPVLVHEPVSLRLRRPWMLRLHGGPHERSSRRRRRRTWERSAE